MNDRKEGETEAEFRESLDHAPSGAPAVGWAIGDRFSTEEVFSLPIDSFSGILAQYLKKLIAARWIASITSWNKARKVWSSL